MVGKLRVIVEEVDNGFVVTSYIKEMPEEKKIAANTLEAVVEVASILKANLIITRMEGTK
jgi:hypothetical protein